ncbi:histidine kinase N-terminal 7TM domain-containing protein [Halodesulfurarchaeum formicicum]|uniref:histidine kinase N-terminal 7TM domain-containing protein n=1 Tax=Halodesulfurarchaeum formicicum TaxID=1873524 RepID=UPI0009F6C8C3|nr:histidine kinase N-terminal 7TM domain-containing protein [Halodesulfurarchaeum formicicum]
MIQTGALIVVLALTAGIGFAVGLLAWQERPEPGATSLSVFMAGQVWWAAFLAFEFQATTLAQRVLWSNVQWIGVVVIPVAWIAFAFSYTGRDEYVRWRYIGVLSIIPAITIGLALTAPYHDLLYTEASLLEQNGLVVLHKEPGQWVWVIAVYTYLLAIGGLVPIFALVKSENLPFRGQSLALILGSIIPWTTSILHNLGVTPIPGFDPTPISFAITGVAFLGALSRFQLLGTNPSPNFRARRLVFDQMDEMAVVVDRNDHIVNLNRSAESMFETDRDVVLGSDASSVVPQYREMVRDPDGSTEISTEFGGTKRIYQGTVTPIWDFHDRKIGHVLTFHDVTDYVRREQRYQVLNRLFRHNLRTESQLILGQAERLAAEHDAVDSIKARAKAIENIGDKARDLAAMFERDTDPDQMVEVEAVIERSVATVTSEYPNATIHDSRPEEPVEVSSLIETVLCNVIENAVEHNPAPEPRVWVSANSTDGRVRITVADDGPGLGEYEIETLEEGSESQLKHTSGLGLWLIKWGTEIAGGTVSFTERDPEGSIVTLDVPASTSSNGDT